MNIVIVGAGFTGIQLARRLISEKNEVTLIDNNEDVVRHPLVQKIVEAYEDYEKKQNTKQTAKAKKPSGK